LRIEIRLVEPEQVRRAVVDSRLSVLLPLGDAAGVVPDLRKCGKVRKCSFGSDNKEEKAHHRHILSSSAISCLCRLSPTVDPANGEVR
jgi:hypothetical protein